jgi:hypothetical protein
MFSMLSQIANQHVWTKVKRGGSMASAVTSTGRHPLGFPSLVVDKRSIERHSVGICFIYDQKKGM